MWDTRRKVLTVEVVFVSEQSHDICTRLVEAKVEVGLVTKPLTSKEVCAFAMDCILVVSDGPIRELECVESIRGSIVGHYGLNDTSPAPLLAETLGSAD